LRLGGVRALAGVFVFRFVLFLFLLFCLAKTCLVSVLRVLYHTCFDVFPQGGAPMSIAHVPLPEKWPRFVRSAVLHVISLAHWAKVGVRPES